MPISNFYIEKGSGDPLILLHGNGENHAYFEHQIEFFSDKFRVIALDTRGHGSTPRGDAPFTIRQFADDLYNFMKEHEISKAHILGFSDGGNIALAFALKYPQCVDRLILNGANLFPKGVRPAFQIPIEIGYRFARIFSNKSEDAKRKVELLGLMVNDPFIKPEELKNLQAKTLVITGKKDLIRESHTKLIAKMIPHSTLSIISGDHFIASKNADEFNRIAADFLSE